MGWDANGVLDLTKGDIELLLDNGGTFRISYDNDHLMLFDGWVDNPPYQSLAEWIDERRDLGVAVRAELPETDLRNALYGSRIERVEIESDTSAPTKPTRVRLITTGLIMEIAEKEAVCSIAFEVNR